VLFRPMKNTIRKKLKLSRETIRALTTRELDAARGAIRDTGTCNACQPLTFVWSGCWSCIQLCFSQVWTDCCLSPPSDCDCVGG
jgi:hypothetical protein